MMKPDVKAMRKRERQYRRLCGMLLDTLSIYGDPDFYFAIAILPDRPAGGFADDADKRHRATHDYERPMPGKRARASIRKAVRQYPDLTVTAHRDWL